MSDAARFASCSSVTGEWAGSSNSWRPSTESTSSGVSRARSRRRRVAGADVAIDFSTAAAVARNARDLAARGTLVIGTTGWQDEEAAVREELARHPVGVIAAPNFALGVNIFIALAANAPPSSWPRAGVRRLDSRAPSRREERRAVRHCDRVSTGDCAGRDTIRDRRRVDACRVDSGHAHGRIRRSCGYHYAHAHGARPHAVFARGALEAARWVNGRRGWFSMRDVLGLQ